MPDTAKRSLPIATITTLAAALALALTGCGAKAAGPAEAIHTTSSAMRVRAPDGVELAVEERGPADAPAIVFIHGLGFSREVWHRQLQGPLAARYHLIAYDLRGHGRSTRPSDDAAYEDGKRWADDLHAVLEATHAKNAVLVGWSLGGLVIAHYLRTHGDGAIGGTVFAAAVTKIAPELFTQNNGSYLIGLVDPDARVREKASREFIRACFERPLPEQELDAVVTAAGVLPASEQIAIQHIALAGTEDALRAAHKPTLVVHGAKDRFIAEAMARHTTTLIPTAKLSIYEAAGHAAFVDESRRFDEELEAFVKAANLAR